MDNKFNVFVYGTLLNGNCNHERYLKNSKFVGNAVLKGYSLYNLGSYPGIKKNDDDYVKGEVYIVDDNTLANLNILEGEGELYSLVYESVEVEGNKVDNVGVYVYLHDVKESNYVKSEYQPWGRIKLNDNLVWYVAYGSNMLKERFMCYIEGTQFRDNDKFYSKCLDITPPRDIIEYSIPYNMYYGNKSGTWNGSGVSFLDVSEPGFAYGVAYLISRQQFEHICKEEGSNDNWYNLRLNIGTHENIPVMTITNCKKRPLNDPNEKYLDILSEGIKENYKFLDDYEIIDYLKSRNNIF